MEQKLVEVLTWLENTQDMCATQAKYWLEVLSLIASKKIVKQAGMKIFQYVQLISGLKCFATG